VSNSWLPPAAGLAWAIVFALIVITHLYHALVMTGRHRLWHSGHILMALGMIAMFAPTHAMIIPAGVGMIVFGLAAVVLAAILLSARARGSQIGPLWVISLLDLAWMIYMFRAMPTMTSTTARPGMPAVTGMAGGLVWLSVLGGVWFAVQALCWGGGLLGRVLDRHGLGKTTSTVQPDERHHGVVDGGAHDWSVRVSLTLMSIGMAYMLLAMQFGMPVMPHMGATVPMTPMPRM
jgi:hypothetical protein